MSCTRSADAVFQPHAAALRRPLALQPAHSPCSLIVVPPCSCSCSALSFLCLLYCSLPAPPLLHRRLSAPFSACHWLAIAMPLRRKPSLMQSGIDVGPAIPGPSLLAFEKLPCALSSRSSALGLDKSAAGEAHVIRSAGSGELLREWEPSFCASYGPVSVLLYWACVSLH